MIMAAVIAAIFIGLFLAFFVNWILIPLSVIAVGIFLIYGHLTGKFYEEPPGNDPSKWER